MDRVKSDGDNDTANPMDWEEWLAAYGGRFLLFARQQARCEADARDLVQEAVVEAWQRQGDGRPPPPALVFSRIRLRAMDQARAADRRAARESAAVGSNTEAWFDGSIEERERQRLIEDAMRGLPAIYREVITLKIWGELTFKEIATVLGIPANTAASRYRYGLAELRKRMKEVVT